MLDRAAQVGRHRALAGRHRQRLDHDVFAQVRKIGGVRSVGEDDQRTHRPASVRAVIQRMCKLSQRTGCSRRTTEVRSPPASPWEAKDHTPAGAAPIERRMIPGRSGVPRKIRTQPRQKDRRHPEMVASRSSTWSNRDSRSASRKQRSKRRQKAARPTVAPPPPQHTPPLSAGRLDRPAFRSLRCAVAQGRPALPSGAFAVVPCRPPNITQERQQVGRWSRRMAVHIRLSN